MIRSLLLATVLFPTISCADSAPTLSKTQTIARANHYVVDKSFGFDGLLDKRMSLVSQASQRTMYTLLGDDEPIIMALSAAQHIFKVEGSQYDYLKPENALLFTIGPKTSQGVYDFAEILIYGTEKAVGLVSYGVSGSRPYSPQNLKQLCTGAYEAVCTLSFDKENALFHIELDPAPENPEAQPI